VNGKSAGRQQKEEFTYRFRWDDVIYEPGNITVVTYKNGTEWAVDSKRTVGAAARVGIAADRTTILGDGYDLSFINATVLDSNGDIVPQATNPITFSLSGPGEILSTNNGDPTDLTVFPSLTRNAFSGLALAVVHANPGSSGKLVISAAAEGLKSAQLTLHVG
jgi:beta-galactosidase